MLSIIQSSRNRDKDEGLELEGIREYVMNLLR